MSPLETRSHWYYLLDSDEASRISSIRNPIIKEAKLAAHVLLRVLLSKIGGGHPSTHSLSKNHLGRPSPRQLPGWSCSLSHDPCGVAVAIGMGSERESHVGVDICRPLDTFHGLSFILHESEKQSLSLDQKAKASQLARYWACKEALLKRWGWGLIPNLNVISAIPGYHYDQIFQTPVRAEPAMTSAITSKVLEGDVAVALAHHHNHVAEWWRTNAAELERKAFLS
jgi:phosphopantetheinyl transferase